MNCTTHAMKNTQNDSFNSKKRTNRSVCSAFFNNLNNFFFGGFQQELTISSFLITPANCNMLYLSYPLKEMA